MSAPFSPAGRGFRHTVFLGIVLPIVVQPIIA
ncbi:hypothetical protein FIU97_15415 [Roseivivax sp. THAF40]|nr:hypothetical protein FIU97_15415 [Roseivivax sp. THAF40]